MSDLKTNVICLGAGPAGLTAGYLLTKKGKNVVILEADKEYVGGISRTVQYKGYHFDIGGHRFFSKSKEVEDFWTEILDKDMLHRPRSSRIFYNGKFFSYPLKAVEALLRLGILKSILCVLSYLKARVFPIPNPKNFEDWVSNQFGKKLFNIFFKTYTEKVWGMSCKEISADWAAQRIKGLSLGSAIWNALMPKRKPKSKDQVIKTLIDSFRYPRKGPGMMWEECTRKIQTQGGKVLMDSLATYLTYDEATKLWTVEYKNSQGQTFKVVAEHVISTVPMRELMNSISPKPHANTLKAADSLKYRDFITVALIVKDHDRFDDNWIYIHDPAVKVGRIQNFKSWSPEMIPDPTTACYGLEYFCFEGDGQWTSSDSSLIELAKKELVYLGLAHEKDIIDGKVVRQKKAYPVYDDFYATHVQTIRHEIDRSYPNLHLIGRNGMHKYNNQDHAMMTAMLTVENIFSGKNTFNIWQVNEDAEYHESGEAGEQSSVSGIRMVPKKI